MHVWSYEWFGVMLAARQCGIEYCYICPFGMVTNVGCFGGSLAFLSTTHRAPCATKIPCQAMSLDASNSEKLSLPGGRSTRTVSERFPQGQPSRDAGRRACGTACAPLRVFPRGVESIRTDLITGAQFGLWFISFTL